MEIRGRAPLQAQSLNDEMCRQATGPTDYERVMALHRTFHHML